MMSRTVVSSRMVLTAIHSSSLRCEMVGRLRAGSTASTPARLSLWTLSMSPTLLKALMAPSSSKRPLDDGDPRERDQDHGRGRDAPHAHELVLRGLRPHLLVKVDGEEGRAGVEHARQRAHEGREQARDHD